MKVVVDGIFFSLAQSGIARVWKSILPILAANGEFDLVMLDRGGAPLISGIRRLPFPSYKDLYTADDSKLIQKVCDHFEADAFVSTYYTTPLSTPSVLLVHDMIPEILHFNLRDRHWQEKALAISCASRLLAVSENTKLDLARLYPATEGNITVAHCGYDSEIFKPLPRAAIAGFLKGHDLNLPYVLLVGSREQHLGYKNAKLFFRALGLLKDPGFEILCVGGEEMIHPESMALIPAGMKARRLELSDAELAMAYNGAEALVYPSLYEGFGLPVVEAMACGCPVITTANGSLKEIAGDAAIVIDGASPTEMAKALTQVRDGSRRATLRNAGFAQSARFSWERTALHVSNALKSVLPLRQDPAYQEFARRWNELRIMQSEVDLGLWRP